MDKICPLMSRPVVIPRTGQPDDIILHKAKCIREECALWISVYSTEGLLQDSDCAIALGPQMDKGYLRV